MVFKNRVGKVRLLKRMLQIELAARTGINFATISRIENGWIKPTIGQRRKLAKVLRAKADWLFPEANDGRT